MKKSLRKLRKSDDGDGKKDAGNGSYNYRMFMMFKRTFKINEVKPPQDVKDVFSKFCEGSDSMSADQFRKFLIQFQGDECRDVSDAERVVDRVLARRHKERDESSGGGGVGGLSFDDFFGYLFFDDLNAPIHQQVHHDMTAPLQDYYIFTGHNSYLTGNQLSSECSDIPIIKALQRGVRAIELDLWPNSSKDDIEVLHGRTLTTPVPLSRCLKSIKEHAFDSSPYPVIITLEDHLTPDLQAKVAEMVTEIFGKLLFYPESDCLKDFPSPEELKKRVILSTKPPKEYIDSEGSKGSSNQSPNRKDSLEDEEQTLYELRAYDKYSGGVVEGIPALMTQNQEVDGLNNLKAPNAISNKDVELIVSPASKSKCQQLEVPHYKTLNGIQAGKPKSDMKETLRVVPGSVKRLSLSEAALEKASILHGADVVRFTQRNVLRIYPKGSRVTSSNYNPIIGWMHGAQMVAFNMQGYGKSLWLMHGMFRSNGGCGYVKKPDLLKRKGANNEVFDPRIVLPVKTNLCVKIYLGDGWRMDFSQTHFDKYSPPDFYTKVHIVGVPADSVKKKTKIIDDDWCPVWDEEFTFPLTVPELALLRIEVREYDKSEKDDFGGQTCLPVSELKPGIRSIPLFDKKGDQMKSVRLLMRFQFV
ncbi:unnamed protein product [Rhodiola kirilowii]